MKSIVSMLDSKKVQRVIIGSAKIGLVTGVCMTLIDVVSKDMSPLIREAINFGYPTLGSLMLGYLNGNDKRENTAGVLSANLFHRASYYVSRGLIALGTLSTLRQMKP